MKNESESEALNTQLWHISFPVSWVFFAVKSDMGWPGLLLLAARGTCEVTSWLWLVLVLGSSRSQTSAEQVVWFLISRGRLSVIQIFRGVDMLVWVCWAARKEGRKDGEKRFPVSPRAGRPEQVPGAWPGEQDPEQWWWTHQKPASSPREGGTNLGRPAQFAGMILLLSRQQTHHHLLLLRCLKTLQ